MERTGLCAGLFSVSVGFFKRLDSKQARGGRAARLFKVNRGGSVGVRPDRAGRTL